MTESATEQKPLNTGSNTQLLFFAALREAIGTQKLVVLLSEPLQISSLLAMLMAQSDNITTALANREILAAINQQLVNHQSWVQPGDEVAFFPPVTGG